MFGSGSIHIISYLWSILCLSFLSAVAGQMLSITASSVESWGRAWNYVNRHDPRIEQCGCPPNRSIHGKCCWENRLGEMETEPNLSWIRCAWFRQNNFWEVVWIWSFVLQSAKASSNHVPFQQHLGILLKASSAPDALPACAATRSQHHQHQPMPRQRKQAATRQPNSQLNASIDASWSSLLSYHVPDVARLICFDAKTMQLTTGSNLSLGPEQLPTAGDSRSHFRTRAMNQVVNRLWPW